MHTPWGASQYERRYGDGIVFYSTAGHGGFRVAPEQNQLIPKAIRDESGTAVGGGKAGWYEEDCEWYAVAYAFPELFVSPHDGNSDHTDFSTVEKVKEIATRGLKSWFPDEYERMTGEEIPEGESYLKDKRLWAERHAGEFVVDAAWGDWHEAVPSGYVGVLARRKQDGAERYFLVPKADYTIPSIGGFVINESHGPWIGPKTQPPSTAEHLVPRHVKASA